MHPVLMHIGGVPIHTYGAAGALGFLVVTWLVLRRSKALGLDRVDLMKINIEGGEFDLLLVLAGLVTVLPLVWFNVAARNLRLSTVGFFQYIAPSMTFLLSVFLYGEAFTQGHAVAFGCIWFALAMISVESWRRSRRMAAGVR
mgnify:CR=1 FL=1